jgi:hypothetical protein
MKYFWNALSYRPTIFFKAMFLSGKAMFDTTAATIPQTLNVISHITKRQVPKTMRIIENNTRALVFCFWPACDRRQIRNKNMKMGSDDFTT